MALDYDAACAAAATRQGLDPVTTMLDTNRIGHAVEQTGGFCMVVTIPARNGGTLAVTQDGPDDAPYLMGFFPGETWRDGSGEESAWDHNLTLDGVRWLALMRGRLV